LEAELLEHGSKRVVYGVVLASNFREVLVEMADTPKYLITPTRVRQKTDLIADFWRQRWLLNRLKKLGVLDDVGRLTYVYPIRLGTQLEVPAVEEPPLICGRCLLRL
jgi:hypothetical protein